MKRIFEEVDLRKEKFKKEVLERKIRFLSKNLVKKLKRKKLFLATIESCTGGALINSITNIPGASEIIKGGFVPYSIQEKIALGISRKLIEKFSVYSKGVAEAMAKKAKEKIKGSHIGVGITGVLTRRGLQNPAKKIGEIYIATIFKDKILVKRFSFPSKKERELVKAMIILKALEMIEAIIKE